MKKQITDSNGIKWDCVKAPFDDPYMYEDDQILCDEFVYLKVKKHENEKETAGSKKS